MMTIGNIRANDVRALAMRCGRRLCNPLTWRQSLCSLILSGALVAYTVPLLAQTRPSGAPPDVRAIIIASLRAKYEVANKDISINYFIERGGIFDPKVKIDHLEISDSVRLVQTMSHGPGWLACIRVELDGSSVLYAVFIVDYRVVDARTALSIDKCEHDHLVSVGLPESVLRPKTKNNRKAPKGSTDQPMRGR